MDKIEIFNELINDSNLRYFYHITNQDCDTILEEGFYMIDKELYKTMIEVPDELKENPTSYVENEQGMKGSYRENGNMIIFGVDKAEIDYFVRESNYIPSNWNNEFSPNYYISPDYILGYINNIEKSFILNESYKYNDSLYL